MRVESGATTVVGVNRFIDDSPEPEIPAPDYSSLEADQVASLKDLKAKRNNPDVRSKLDELSRVAESLVSGPESPQMMERIIDAVRARATVGEIASTLETKWGRYSPRG
jgi:methylmalonyl-CoA mutase N-terminal domain/subunit